jgi:hypothetical protein
MAKEWANKDRYNPSRGVLESHMPLPRGKAIVRTVPAWGEMSAMGGRDPARGVKPVTSVWKLVRPVWRQQGDQGGFHAHAESQFVSVDAKCALSANHTASRKA